MSQKSFLFMNQRREILSVRLTGNIQGLHNMLMDHDSIRRPLLGLPAVWYRDDVL